MLLATLLLLLLLRAYFVILGAGTDLSYLSEILGPSHLTLEATFRHLYFEIITHLYNIQRLKRAQGLTTRVEIPYEGYWALPDWDRTEP